MASVALLVLYVQSEIHYNDVIMSTMASQITSLTIVYSTINSGADQRKHQSSASLAFVRGIHPLPVNTPHKGSVARKCFHLMTSSCCRYIRCPIKYIHSFAVLFFVAVISQIGVDWQRTLTHILQGYLLALWKWYDYPASGITWKDMGKFVLYQKHNKYVIVIYHS